MVIGSDKYRKHYEPLVIPEERYSSFLHKMKPLHDCALPFCGPLTVAANFALIASVVTIPFYADSPLNTDLKSQ